MAKVSSKFRAQIVFDETGIKTIGPLSLLKLVNSKIATEGEDPKKWQRIKSALHDDEIMLNNFIDKVCNRLPIDEHIEICHCRMVNLDKIESAIFQGCRTVDEIIKYTLASTGCGTCRKDIEKIINQMMS